MDKAKLKYIESVLSAPGEIFYGEISETGEVYQDVCDASGDFKWMYETILQLQEKIERMELLQKNCDALTRHFAKDVKHLFPLENMPGYGQLCERVLEQKEEIDRLRFHLGWPKK